MRLKVTQRYLKGWIWRTVHQWPPLKDCSNFYDHSAFTKARVLHSDNFQGCLCAHIISEPEAPAVVCLWFLVRMLEKATFSQWCNELPWKMIASNFNSKGWLRLNFLDICPKNIHKTWNFPPFISFLTQINHVLNIMNRPCYWKTKAMDSYILKSLSMKANTCESVWGRWSDHRRMTGGHRNSHDCYDDFKSLHSWSAYSFHLCFISQILITKKKYFFYYSSHKDMWHSMSSPGKGFLFFKCQTRC